MKSINCLTAMALGTFMSATAAMPHHIPVITGEQQQRPHAISKGCKTPGAYVSRGVRTLSQAKAPDGPSSGMAYITEAEGTTQTLSKTGLYYTYTVQGVQGGYSDGNILTAVTSEDGKKLYLKNVLSGIETEAYIVGDIEGNKVTFEFPQWVNHTVDFVNGSISDIDDYILLCSQTGEGGSSWFYPTDNQTYTMTIGTDGSLTPDDSDVMLADCMWVSGKWLGDGEDPYWDWIGEGDIITAATPVTATAVSVPQSVRFANWVRIEEKWGYEVGVGFNGKDVYLRNLYPSLPDACVKGTLADDGTITIPNNQFMGIDPEYNAFVYFQAVKVTGSGANLNLELTDNITFSYDSGKGTMESDGIYCFSSVPDKVFYFFCVEKPSMHIHATDFTVTSLFNVICNPTEDVIDYIDVDNPGEVYFTMPNIDRHKNLLDLDNYFYQAIVDNEPYTFSRQIYMTLKKDMTDVPYTFTGATTNVYEFAYNDDGLHLFTFYFPLSDIGRMGVRTGYRNPGGETVYSDTEWIYVREDAVDTLQEDSRRVTAVRYIDINGNETAHPGKGIYIKAETLEDGSVRVAKIAR